MIDRVSFYLPHKDLWVRPQEDYGILLKTRDVSPPKPKVFRVELEGADGAVDFTEWAGTVLYETREVKIELRDMHERRSGVIRELLGRRAELYFSDEPDWFYSGRCDGIEEVRQKQRVVDLKMTFTCQPYKLASRKTAVNETVSTSKTISLAALRMPAIPEIKLTSAATLSYWGNTYNLEAGTHIVPGIKIVEEPSNLYVTGSTTITITWRDGEL